MQRASSGLKELLGEPEEVTVAEVEGAGPLSTWNDIFRVSQARPESPLPLSRAGFVWLRQPCPGLQAKRS